MPELRKDPIIGRWVIISMERGKRPSDFNERAERKKKSTFCPFCPGNEDKTPPEIFAIRSAKTKPNTPGWSLRVVPNKYPALQIQGDLNRRGEGIFDKMNGVGAHEVIIETPEHDKTIDKFSIKEIENIFMTYRLRIQDLKKDKRLRYPMIFKNHGSAAGASLEHSHSQLIALPIVPKRVLEELDGSKRYFNYKERCIFCDIIYQELEDGIRIVLENEHFIVWSPYAPRFPFEIWILPREHHSNFEYISDQHINSLARIIKEFFIRMNLVLENPPYNFLIHTTPINLSDNLYYHWHIEFIPKLTKIAGFEWGTGFYINPTPPEEAAKFLREVKIQIFDEKGF